MPLFYQWDTQITIFYEGNLLFFKQMRESGNEGGRVVAEGTPEELAKVKESYTAQYLKRVV
jgi:hypothetical protein